MSIESMTPSNHLVLCRSLLLPSVFPSIRVFSDGSAVCVRWPKGTLQALLNEERAGCDGIFIVCLELVYFLGLVL